MITIYRKYNWYRAYQYGKYRIKDIKFYDKKGIVAYASSGWLENKGKDLEYIRLNIDELPIKRKEDYRINGAYLISRGKDYADELQADLYINIEVVNLEFKEYVKEYNSIRKHFVGKDFDNQEFILTENVKWLEEDLYNYQHQIESLGKKLEQFYSGITEEEFKNTLKELRKYGKKYFEEKQKIKDYNVEDYIKEIESEGK